MKGEDMTKPRKIRYGVTKKRVKPKPPTEPLKKFIKELKKKTKKAK